MSPFLKFLEDHHEALATAGGFLLMAYAVSMPQNWDAGFARTAWKWFYDGTQEAISMRSGKLVSGPSPRPAVEVPPAVEAPRQPSTQIGETHVQNQ